ncbi:MAG: cyclic nucleotide-binding/CBS domain-containing protein [Clostridia bacterium]
MLSLPLRAVLEPGKLVTASPELRVADAALLMKERNVGAVLVVRQGRLIGIFTERDAVRRILAAGRDPAAVRLEEVMTPDPTTIDERESFGYALLVMHEHGFRHLPVLRQGELCGVLSARHALDPDLEEFTVEATRRTSLRRRA